MKYESKILYSDMMLEVDPRYLSQLNTDRAETNRLLKAANEGDPSAEFILGVVCDKGGQYGLAAHYYESSSKKGFAPAAHNIGCSYYLGDLFAQNEEHCKEWMANAVSKGCSQSAFFLGSHYDSSMPQSKKPFNNQNDSISSFWYQIGAKMGNKACMYNIGLNFLNGVGVDWNNELGTYWINKAAMNGVSEARNMIAGNVQRWSKRKILKFEKETFSHPIIEFGNYYIHSKTKKNPIQWIVCFEDDEKMVLVSKLILDFKPFQGQTTSNTWDDCELRSFLNGEFLNSAFSESERRRIIAQDFYSMPNPVFESKLERYQSDYVSIPDVNDLAYRMNFNEWQCQQSRASSLLYSQFGNWWLRNWGEPGIYHKIDIMNVHGNLFAIVNKDGEIDFVGVGGSLSCAGVRPMIYVKKLK